MLAKVVLMCYFLILGTTTGPSVFPLMQCGSGPGDTVTLGCLATGFTPSSVTFAWQKDGTALTNSIDYPSVQVGNSYTGVSQIQVNKQDWENKANFQCLVDHAGGKAQAPFQVPSKTYAKLFIHLIS